MYTSQTQKHHYAPLPFIFAKIPLTVFLQPFTVHGQTAPAILMSVCAPTIQCPYLKPISLVKAMEPCPESPAFYHPKVID